MNPGALCDCDELKKWCVLDDVCDKKQDVVVELQ